MADRRTASVLRALGGLIVGAGLLALLAWRLEWAEVGRVLSRSRPLLLLPIASAVLAHYVLKGLRWHTLLANDVSVKPWLAIRLTLVGFLFNSVTPARIGELGRPYLLSANRPAVSLPFAVATVLADKLFDLAAVLGCLLIVAASLPLPEAFRRGILLLVVAIALGAAVVLTAVWWRRSWAARLASRPSVASRALVAFADGLATISSLRVGLLAGLYTLGSFALLWLSMVLVTVMLGLEVGGMACVFVLGAVGVGFMIPSPPTHAGTFHYFAAQALILAGAAEAEAAFAFALVAHATQVAVVGIFGAACLAGLDWRLGRR